MRWTPEVRPRFDDLPGGTARGLWGEDDGVGAFNDITAADVAAAAALVTGGAVFALNWDQRLPDPPLFGRGSLTRTVVTGDGGVDEYYDGFWPQHSSQWDGLGHIRHPGHGFYGGRAAGDPRNGIEHLARRGIAGRFVLADVGRWRAASGRPLRPQDAEAVPVAEVAATLRAQGVWPRAGDILLLRFGWITWYEQLDHAARTALAGRLTAVGLRPGTDTLRWLWDTGIVAVAADNPAVEALPAPPAGGSLHTDLLALLGVALGELWSLDRLAEDCARDGRYTGLLVSAPLHLPGGAGSPANAVALK